ncbi:SIMPL domain-containing protein [Vibrio rarus]|uniref:SIMPL domain-containing protein n=1 Tax=Vibrio rarus TaxID=413403 RepID=UPI0021C28FDA|nr:SIMPL domain-containing protein [Vibrio rarus]
MKILRLIFSIAILVCALGAQGQSLNFAHLITTGFGEVRAEPDMAEFSVQVVVIKESAEQAKVAADLVVDKLLQKLQQSAVSREDIQSGNIQLLPQMHYPKKGDPEQRGYKASRQVMVVVEQLTALPKLLDIALASGINRIDRVQLSVKDPSKYQAIARSEAIKDAQLKASAVAKGFNKSVDSVWQVRYQSAQSRPMLSRSVSMDSAARGESYQDATIVIKDRVEVIFKLK